jgi:DNA-binding transcriptional LysR family regulator
MLYLVVKAAVSGVLIALISEVAKRYPGFGGLIASLPLVSVLGMLWLWRDKPDPRNMATHVEATFYFVLPSLPMFLVIP